MKLVQGTYLPDDDTFFEKHFKNGEFEQKKLDSALTFNKKWVCAVDVGANVGSWSRQLSHRFDTVISFEPNKEVYKCLKENVKDIKNIVTLNMALGHKNMRMTIKEDESRKGNSGACYLQEGKDLEVIALDTKINFKVLDFLKIDVEGFEAYVILGALRSIMRHKPTIIMETKPFEGRYELTSEDANNILIRIGYKEVAKFGHDRVYSYDCIPS